MNKNTAHIIEGRKVQFDFNEIPKHWVPHDPLSTHILNAAHVLLPAGEFWFCRVFNKALPHVSDDKLKADVKGFIHQEAIHGRTHQEAQKYFDQHDLDLEPLIQKIHFLFEVLLGENPLGLKAMKHVISEDQWLVTRLGFIAAIEHYTGVVGQWSLENTSLDAADPTMTDLFRWHLAEEVEHRNVAFELFEHMFESELGFQVSKNTLMFLILPFLAIAWLNATQTILKQDKDAGKFRRMSLPRLMLEVEKIAKRTDHLPKVSRIVGATLRWFNPSFHPEQEGDTEQALRYLAKSPAAQAAHQRKIKSTPKKTAMMYS